MSEEEVPQSEPQIEVEAPPTVNEESVEQASDYEPGSGNSMLDSLYPSSDPQEPEVSEPEEVNTQSVSIEQALFKAAEGPAEEKKDEPEEKVDDTSEKVDKKLVKEDLGEISDPPNKSLLESSDFEEEPEPDPTPGTSPSDLLAEKINSILEGLTLSEEEQETMELAMYDSKNGSVLAVEMAEFLKKKASYLNDNPNDMDEYGLGDNQYEEFVKKNEPKFTVKQRRAIEKKMLKDEVLQEARAEIAESEYRRDLSERKPQVETQVRDFYVEVATDIFPPEMTEEIKQNGIEKAREKYSFEVPMLEESVNQVSFYAKQFLEISNGLVKYDSKNSVHKQISDFVDNQSQIFLKEGGDKRVRDGKKFAPRAKFNSLTLKQREKHWTFSDSDILGMVKIQCKHSTEQQLSDLRSKLSNYGASSPSAPPISPEPVQVPKAKPTKSVGATTSAKASPNANGAFVDLLGI